MKFIPILFSTEMVQAILEGRKTQTRREIKPQPPHQFSNFGSAIAFVTEKTLNHTVRCPYGKPGDVIWVRETWAPAMGDFAYKADYTEEILNLPENKGLWSPSIHMPKAACRIWLRVKSVRVERLQNIKEEDAVKEGINTYHEKGHLWSWYGPSENPHWGYGRIGRARFAELWAKINGWDSWKSNPWVWVIEFEKLDTKPEGF